MSASRNVISIMIIALRANQPFSLVSHKIKIGIPIDIAQNQRMSAWLINSGF
jgi:hypothetical protein